MSESRERSPFPAVGGHPGFDLVDTVHWRLDSSRAIDTLADFDDVVAWCAQMGVVDDGALAAVTAADPDAAAREFRAIVALREAIYEAVFTSSESAAHLIAEEYVAARGRSTLQRDAGSASWRWRVPGDVSAPRAAIAVLAHDLITSDLHAARQCADDACGWVYLDTSPRHNRIWCTAAGCGNRNRVARHAARKGA
ncbi:putative RNA-binding Zn ribbon-like protein [Microbacterium sp. SORGH_AS428]|uniref:CGNR zinc finger domain-containing protein n=1 Tax=Microbacterium sp. SORGH_AS_0428 TaxID=3041788 RepID=UPI00286174B7|nr:CGNR zinc finger domain-containing protein [Microbacterium sp. SORGH_AS_0428]MDR6199418.1 putative RNA-binding Zn ribbon-like protein [Microbacterium sp. SORGH_AS_0428]